MILIRSLKNLQISRPLSLTIGNFDGFHLGHQKLLDEIKENAQKNNYKSAVLSFEPHPSSFFKKEKHNSFRISSLAQKLSFIKDYNIDYAIILPFNQALAAISAQDFISEIIVNKLNTKNLVIGYDFVFGKNRSGNIDLLESCHKKYGFELQKIEQLKINNHNYSSSNIRNQILQGNIELANQIIGKNFTISSTVQNGRKLGASINFPTANFFPKQHIIKPKYGVYKTTTYLPQLNKKFDSITNFGIRPTLQDNDAEIFETHILNFLKNIYGQKIYLEFIDFIRPEMKFDNLAQLKQQISADIKSCYPNYNANQS